MNHYLDNKKQLALMSAEFMDTIDSASNKCEWLNESKSDKNNFAVKTDNNDIIYAYEKKKAVNSVKKSIEELKFLERDATIILGLGGGLLASEILKKKHKKHIIVIVEPELALINNFLTKHSIVKHLKNNSVQFITNSELINTVINVCDSYHVIQEWHLLTESYIIAKPSIYEKCFVAVKNSINQLQCNNGTIASAGKEIALNDIKNLPYVLPYPGVNKLNDMFKGKPAVVVNTGPSLEKNIHHLIKNQNKIIIIAVAQALRILLAYDIRPDFICTVDFGEVNKTHFDGLMDSGVPLIALNRTHAGIIKEWQGPKFIAANYSPGYEETLAGVITDNGHLDQGGSVSHFAFSAAVKMGCNPIALIGQDLALTESSHNPNADSMGNIEIVDDLIYWTVTDPKSKTLNKDVHCMGPATKVPGYYGDFVITNIGLASFIAAFEQLFHVYKDRTIYDATEGGAFIKGSKRISLKEFIKVYAKKKLNKIIPDFKVDYEPKIDKSIELLKKEITLLKDIIFNCEEGIKSNDTIDKESLKKKRNEIKLKLALKDNKKYSKKAEKLTGENALLNICIYNMSRQIQTREMRVDGKLKHLLKENDDLKIRVKRNKLILKSTLEAANEILNCYKETEILFDEYKKDNSVLLKTSEDYIPNISDYDIYFKNNNFARPISEAKNILKNDPQNEGAQYILQKCLMMRDEAIEKASKIDNTKSIKYHDLIYQARMAGTEDQNYDKALELLNKAIKLYSEKSEARWGKATCLRHVKQLNRAMTEYRILMKNDKESKVYQFEYAQILIEYDIKAGLVYMWDFLSMNPGKYDSFWKRLYQLYKLIDKEKSDIALKNYIDKFPADEKINE